MEAPELRTARRTVFKRNDGTFEVHEATNAVNFQDAKGAWQQIDNHLVADGAGGFKNKANSFTVSFKPTGISSSACVAGMTRRRAVSLLRR